MSVSHSRLGAAAVKFRQTLSSWTGGPGLGVLTAAGLLAEDAPPAVVAADPPGGSLGHRLTRRAGLVHQETVAELRVAAVRVEQRVGPVCPGQFGVGDWAGQPPANRAGRPAPAPGTSPAPAQGRWGRPARGRAGTSFTGPAAVPPTWLSPPSTRPGSTRTSARSPRGRPQLWPTPTPVDHPSQSHLLLADVIHPSPAQKLSDIPKRVGHPENLSIHTHPTPTRLIRRVHDHRQIAGHGCQPVTGCSDSASSSTSTSGCS